MSEKLLNANLQSIIGENIKSLNMTITQLAAIAHVPTADMLSIVQGEMLPSLESLRRLSDYFHLDINYFFKERPNN